MSYPLVGERVPVNDRPGAWTIVRNDHNAGVATLASPPENGGPVPNMPLSNLRGPRRSGDGEAVDPEMIWDLVRSSRSRVLSGLVHAADVRETIRATILMIRQTQERLAESERAIERFRTLGCDRNGRP